MTYNEKKGLLLLTIKGKKRKPVNGFSFFFSSSRFPSSPSVVTAGAVVVDG